MCGPEGTNQKQNFGQASAIPAKKNQFHNLQEASYLISQCEVIYQTQFIKF